MSQVSADFPDSLRGPHCPVRDDPHNKNLQKVMANRGSQIRGKNVMESSVMQKPVTQAIKTGDALLDSDYKASDSGRPFVTFNPSILKASSGVSPPKLNIANALDPVVINQFRHHLASAFENRHAELLQSNNAAFFKDSGELEMFVDQGGRNIDLLPAWQHTHPRDLDENLRLKIPRAKSEFYFDRFNTPFGDLKEFSHTERLATSSILRARHLEAREKRERHLKKKPSMKVLGEDYTHEDNIHMFQMKTEKRTEDKGEPPTASGDFDVVFTKVSSTASDKLQASETANEITKFERKNHQLLDLKDMTKKELKDIINREGEEEPGKLVWDGKQCVFKKLSVKKDKYLSLAEELLVKGDDKPIIQKAKLLMNEITIPGSGGKLDTIQHVKINCLLSIYALRNGAVMLEIYIAEKLMVLRKVWNAHNLADADFEPCPSNTIESKWLAWSNILFSRLKIINSSEVILVPPLGLKSTKTSNLKSAAVTTYAPSKDIPNGYSLQDNSNTVDRRHVTEYFK